jgi:hypothetical protein
MNRKKRILQDKQFHLQLKSEQKQILQNVLERRFNGSVTHGLRKEHVLRPQCIMGDDLHNKQTNICITNHRRLLRKNN